MIPLLFKWSFGRISQVLNRTGAASLAPFPDLCSSDGISLNTRQSDKHHVNGNRMVEPFPEGTQMAIFGMGCFWGAERKFWRQKGVYSTQVGYAGGYTPNPTYKEVCSGKTGHTEAVRVVYQPENISFEKLLKVFWENHDPTQGMRQGNDFGTQYRSAIYTFSQEQMEAALKSKEEYQKALYLQPFQAHVSHGLQRQLSGPTGWEEPVLGLHMF
nr:mitochondrial peptide methionine sulfoxide reductase isoform X6 [Anser cygnoides]